VKANENGGERNN